MRKAVDENERVGFSCTGDGQSAFGVTIELAYFIWTTRFMTDTEFNVAWSKRDKS